MTPIHGRDILVSILVDGEFIPVLCAIDMTFQCSQEVLLATSADTGKWRKKRLRQLSEWRVEVSGLSKIYDTDGQAGFFYLLLENVRGSEQIIQMMFSDEEGNTQVIEGEVLIPDIVISGNVGSFADVSVTFEGSGEFTLGDVDSDVDSDLCDDLFSDTWTMAEGEDSITGAGQEGRTFTGKQILEVDVEGIQYEYTDGTPGNREYSYNGNTIEFEAAAPEGGQKVFVLWKS